MYNVMIVDDEPFIAEGLIDSVDWSGYGLEVVGSAENGKAALELLRRIAVDILITDISMPVMNGLELIRQAREILPHLKVIILSGFNEFDYLKEGMKLGIENYLLKPVNFQELRSTLSSTVDKLNTVKPERVFGDDEIGILRDNIMLRWLTGRISPQEFSDRLSMLGIELTKPYAAVAIVRSDGERDGYAETERMLAGEESAIVFRDAEDDAVIVFGMNDPDSDRGDAERRLRELAEKETIRSGGIRIALGPAKPVAEAAVSYERARRAQQFFLVAPELSFIDFDRLPVASGTGLPEGSLTWASYAKDLVAKDNAELLRRIAGDFAAIRASENADPVRVKGAAVELIIRIKMETDKLNRPEASEAYRNALERVMNADSLERIEIAVKDAAAFASSSFAGEDMSPVIKQVLRHIEEHYAESLTLKSMGQQFHIHPNYLGQLFHKQTGETFADYINKYRIEKAKKLLLESSLKVNEIARQVGYWEIGYFYKQFKKHVGIVPGEYKGFT
ncbi:response regulator transcription factor [Cohnella terricola]|uniref:Response regulator transcription factor n=1 Tax=Cohnella terricola TaxID=1289167 RepID=A0A559JNL2_9BACL|nr:response regulator transcription factor [Cohnella terricola]TVY01428.1 response regulator transcription factor [Cohnella terricola]